MREFDALMEVARQLNDPEKGCPWDIKQTFQTLRSYILEEAHEALEAIDSEQDEWIIEELGDLFYTVIFYAKVAEREGRFSMEDILDRLKEKLVRRHPHVFGEKKADSMEEVIQNWEKVKKEEKKERKSALEGIPKTLPSLQKATKMFSRMKRSGYQFSSNQENASTHAQAIYGIVRSAVEEGVDIESVFRALLSEEEKKFIDWESHSC